MVTVIIPVNNAAAFLAEAVHSADIQAEVAEILLIEDGSTDNSLEICKKLEQEYSKVSLHQHPGGINKGVGASRNLGISLAKYDWIAFLDADDYYLNNRFQHSLSFLKGNTEYDACAEGIGAIFHDDIGKSRFLTSINLPEKTLPSSIKTGLSFDVPAENLFEELLLAENGHLHLNGFLIKKESILKTSLFNEEWPIAEDSSWFLKQAYKNKIKTFSTDKIVAIRRIHSGNRWNASLVKRLYYYSLHIKDLYNYIDYRTLSKKATKKMVWAYVRSHKSGYFQTDNKIMKIYFASLGYFYLLFNNTRLLIKAYL